MNHELELKLQACLDEELSPEESRRVTELLRADSQAQSVYEELRATRLLLAGNELERAVPEAREFYWSKIERAIALEAQPESAPAPVPALLNGWLRLAVRLAGATALVAVFALMMLRTGPSPKLASGYFHEVETPIQEAAGITFHSQAAGMTVVWIQSQ